MSRQRKKIEQSEQEQVSIFDSEEQHQPHHHQHQNKTKNSQPKQHPHRKPGRKPSVKHIEKKLSQEEASIMKSLLGQYNKLTPTTQQYNSTIRQPDNNQTYHQIIKQTYQQIVKKQQNIQSAPKVTSTLDTDSTFLQVQLTWIDLQDVKTTNHNNCRQQSYNSKQQQSTNYSINEHQLQNNHNQCYNQDKARYPLNYKRAARRQYTNPYYTTSRFNQYNPHYDYQPHYNNYDYTHHQRMHMRGNFNSHRQIYQQSSPYDEYGYGYQPYDNKYALYPSSHIIAQVQQPASNYPSFQGEQFQQIKVDSKWRREKILQQIQKLRQQCRKIEDESETQPSHNQQPANLKIEQQGYGSHQLWRYQPIPQPAKYVPPLFDHKDTKYQKSKTQDRIIMIDFILKENPFLTQFQMAEVLRALDPILNARIERSVVLRLLKMSGYKKKKIIVVSPNRNSEANINLRKQFALHYRKLKAQDYSIAYYDQMIINEYYDKESGWCKEHEDVDARLQRFMSRSLVVVAVLSTLGSCYWQARFGCINDEEYSSIISKILKKTAQDQPKRVLIINPVSYRRPEHLVQIAARRNWAIAVLPKQNLYLNPLQFYFSQVKQRLKRRRYDSLQGMFGQTVECLNQVDKDGTVKQVVSKIQMFVDKAEKKQCF